MDRKTLIPARVGLSFLHFDKAGTVEVEDKVREMQVMLPQLEAGIRSIIPNSGHSMDGMGGFRPLWYIGINLK
jgi:hypothetical protein